MSVTVRRPCADSIFVWRFEMLPFASTMSLPCTRPILTSSLSIDRALVSPPFSVIVRLIMRPRSDGRSGAVAGSRMLPSFVCGGLRGGSGGRRAGRGCGRSRRGSGGRGGRRRRGGAGRLGRGGRRGHHGGDRAAEDRHQAARRERDHARRDDRTRSDRHARQYTISAMIGNMTRNAFLRAAIVTIGVAGGSLVGGGTGRAARAAAPKYY